jgi:hypothetical protein
MVQTARPGLTQTRLATFRAVRSPPPRTGSAVRSSHPAPLPEPQAGCDREQPVSRHLRQRQVSHRTLAEPDEGTENRLCRPIHCLPRTQQSRPPTESRIRSGLGGAPHRARGAAPLGRMLLDRSIPARPAPIRLRGFKVYTRHRRAWHKWCIPPASQTRSLTDMLRNVPTHHT